MNEFAVFSGHTLLTRALRPGMTVLDLGTNHGRFSEDLSSRYPGMYHAVEPNPQLAAKLEARSVFTSVRAAAVTDRTGPIVLRVAANDEGSSVLLLPATSIWYCTEIDRTTVDGVALPELLAGYPGRIDVLKMDIEGAEISALPTVAPTDLERIGSLSVEFHGARVFGLGISQRLVSRTIRRLRQQGFTALSFAPGNQDVLFINRRIHGISRGEAMRWQTLALKARWRRRLFHEDEALRRQLRHGKARILAAR